MNEKCITSERGTTYYWIERKCEAGGGAPCRTLIFLPGLTANHHLFDKQIPYFAQKYTVLVWDAPGHGKSRPYKDFSYANLAEELKTIMDTENIEKAVLIGQSAGGFVSQSLIAKYPERAEGLFTIGTCPYGTEYYSKSDLFWLRQIEWLANLYPDKTLRRAMAKMCGTTPEGRENMMDMLADYEKKELCHLMYLGFAGFIPEIQKIKELRIACPVCITVGENDKTGKVMKYDKEWSQRAGFPLHIIAGAAHNANYDKPEEVNRLIDDFLLRI